jgi:hypothetical protein
MSGKCGETWGTPGLLGCGGQQIPHRTGGPVRNDKAF